MQALDAHLRAKNARDLRRQRSRQDPVGEGLYENVCECGQRFKTDDTWAALCPSCEGENARPNEAGERPVYHYSRFKRGGFR